MREQLQKRLSDFSAEFSREAPHLCEALRYVAESGGKQLRGILCVSTAEAFGCSEIERVVGIGAALEALHAASLIHDDLPALDNDDMRRGRPSCHKAYGEATAVLAGDFLIGLAFKIISESKFSAEQRLSLTRVVSETWLSLCVGQQLDLGERSSHGHGRMIALKTGALFGCSVACGAIAAGMDSDVVAQAREWGVRLGIHFQRLDDVADGDGFAVSDAELAQEQLRLRSELDGLLPRANKNLQETLSLILRGT